jgi:hypothetical protein
MVWEKYVELRSVRLCGMYGNCGDLNSSNHQDNAFLVLRTVASLENGTQLNWNKNCA